MEEVKDRLRKEYEFEYERKPLWLLSEIEILPNKRDMLVGHISYVKFLENKIKEIYDDFVPCLLCADCQRKCKTEGDLIECNDYLPNEIA